MQVSGEYQSVNPVHELGIRPFCRCCGGGEFRKGKSCTKSKSREKNIKNARAKPRYKDKR